MQGLGKRAAAIAAPFAVVIGRKLGVMVQDWCVVADGSLRGEGERTQRRDELDRLGRGEPAPAWAASKQFRSRPSSQRIFHRIRMRRTHYAMNMRLTYFLTAALSVLVMIQPAMAQDDELSSVDALNAIFESHFAWEMYEFPERAMARGDYSYSDRITDNSLDAHQRRHNARIRFLGQLNAVDPNKLSEQDRINYELFKLILTRQIDGHRFRTFLTPVDGRSGPQQDVPQMHERVRFDSLEDYENYLTRLSLAPTMIDNTTALMQAGLREGRTPAKVTMGSLPAQYDAALKSGLKSLRDPLRRPPAGVTPEQTQALLTRLDREILPAITAALTRQQEFLVQQYLPNCRASVAARDLPEGEAFYNFQLAGFTTTDLTALQIHELGLQEVARIRAEMMEVIRGSDFMQTPEAVSVSADDAKLFAAFINDLRTNPRFYHTSEEALLTGYRDICKRVDPELTKLFKTLPRLPYGVRPVPKFMAPTQTTAYYWHGDIRNAEPGYFYANTYALDQRPKYEMIPLALHEAVPGHHLQIALAQELEGVPEFRKDGDFTAFSEGWALYSERLGLEMGLFSDPYDNFGRLLYEMWRACRLVVDTGMHALGWSREQAIQFMRDNTALSELNIENEIDRYINWPGQATAYKIGELKIRELRAKAEQELGERFDIREFHDVVLNAGAIPLTVLERRVNDWIAATAAQ